MGIFEISAWVLVVYCGFLGSKNEYLFIRDLEKYNYVDLYETICNLFSKRFKCFHFIQNFLVQNCSMLCPMVQLSSQLSETTKDLNI